MSENIFENRVFNADELEQIKNVVDDVVETLYQINDLQEHIKDVSKSLVDRINENAPTKEDEIKSPLIKKLAVAKIKQKENIENSRTQLDEVEAGLSLLYKM